MKLEVHQDNKPSKTTVEQCQNNSDKLFENANMDWESVRNSRLSKILFLTLGLLPDLILKLRYLNKIPIKLQPKSNEISRIEVFALTFITTLVVIILTNNK